MSGIWRYVRSAPLTYVWLVVLLVTTLFQHSLSRSQLHTLLLEGSTNLHHLAVNPLEVLFASLLWIDGYYWWPYVIVFSVFLAPAERWLGRLRWLAAGLTAHIVATYISEGFLYLAIQHADASPRLVNARDIGVSYVVVGIAGLLTYHVARPWRWIYLTLALVTVGVPLILRPDFTPIGHFTSLLVGLALYPLARGREAPLWDPARVFRRRLADQGT